MFCNFNYNSRSSVNCEPLMQNLPKMNIPKISGLLSSIAQSYWNWTQNGKTEMTIHNMHYAANITWSNINIFE